VRLPQFSRCAMKKYLSLLIIIISFPSCCIWPHYDDLQIYVKGYTPGFSQKLRMEGFYYTIDYGEDNPAYKGSVQPIFFYPDGSVACGVYYKNMDALLRKLPDVHVFWGFYKITDDQLLIETVIPPDASICRGDRYTSTAQIDNDSLTIIDKVDSRGRLRFPIEKKYFFTPFQIKPDVQKNWIKTFEKYRIDQ